MAAALSDYIIHLPSTHFQTRWLDTVGSLLEDKMKLARWMEGPFVVLAQIRPLQSGDNIVINVVHRTTQDQLAIFISVRLGDRKSQGGGEHLHPHQHPHHGTCDGFCG